MKLIFLLTSAAVMLASEVFAQNAPPRAATGAPPRPGAVPAPDSSGLPAGEEARFDLKFPGGPVKEFVAAVNKALGKPVNVVIPKEAEATLIPAVEMYRVTVSALFRALGAASQRQVAVPVGTSGNQRTYQYQNVGFKLTTADPPEMPDSVWTFQVSGPADVPEDEPISTRVVQYYPVAEYLTHFSVEDITTAIEAGWRLQSETKTEKTAPPTIKFHEETKLLICAGSNSEIEIIPQVLKGLSQMLQYPPAENLKITRKAKEIVIPKLEFREATVREAVEFIRRKAVELDPQKQGINILLHEINGPGDQRVSLTLVDTPVMEVLRLTAELANVDLEIRDAAIILRTRVADPHAAGGGGRDFAPPPGIPGLQPPPTPPPPIGRPPVPGAPRPQH